MSGGGGDKSRSENGFKSVDFNMSVSCTHSESQKKLLSSSVHRKFDMISSSNAAPSDLGRQGRESVKVQVNTLSLPPTGHKSHICVTAVPSEVPLHPTGLRTNADSRVAAVFVLWAVQPCGGV